MAEKSTARDNGVIGKVIVGYQGWFGTPEDGSPMNRWRHWASSQPGPGNQSFELWPDTREYPQSALCGTGYKSLGNGMPAKLFSSSAPAVVDIHFRWMREYNIDGAALQRFGSELQNPKFREIRNGVAASVRKAAEENDRIFYIMYDISGMRSPDWTEQLRSDWRETICGALHLTESPNYSMEDGKAVVCIWGMGFTDRYGSPEDCLKIIEWFKEQGCYVIGGVPTNWRDGDRDCRPGFLDVFLAFDMISPWSVGRFNSLSGADSFKDKQLAADYEYCKAKDLAYQPVIWPGFAWSNWNGGKPNMIPRLKGEFMWRQALNVRDAQIGQAYIAMFDEYDEGTAIAKAAEDSSMAPVDQYFQTTSIDGTFLSSDFYLRLSDAVTKLIKGRSERTEHPPIPDSIGPVWFRTGWESADAQLPPDASCKVIHGCSHLGGFAVKAEGTAGGDCIFASIPVEIPVTPSTAMEFWIRPEDGEGSRIIVDLLTSEGHWLSDLGAADQNGVPLSGPHGSLGGWSAVKCAAGRWLAGRTVTHIAIRYRSGGSPAAGRYSAYIDDLVIAEGSLI